jgi:hypothetical protein
MLCLCMLAIFCWGGRDSMIGGSHDGFKNMYSFVKGDKTIKLAPLTPSQVYKDQLKLKNEIAQKRKSKSENEHKRNSKSENEQKKKKRVRVKISKKERVKKKIERWLRVKKKEWNHERKKKESLQREKERQKCVSMQERVRLRGLSSQITL